MTIVEPVELWKMPFPSSWGVETRLDLLPGRTVHLHVGDRTGEHLNHCLRFEDVLAYKCSFLSALKSEMFFAYDRVMACPSERLQVESSTHKCFVICFDDGPCYEIVATGLSIQSDTTASVPANYSFRDLQMISNVNTTLIERLNLLEREAVALVCLECFAVHYKIAHVELSKFVEHLWGIVNVTPEQWVSWADAFDHMEVLKKPDTFSPSLANAIPGHILPTSLRWSEQYSKLQKQRGTAVTGLEQLLHFGAY